MTPSNDQINEWLKAAEASEQSRFVAFAALAAAWGAQQEREACAKLVESRKTGANELMDAVRDMEAAAIRTRGEVKP